MRLLTPADESHAMRREWCAALLALLLGFVASVAAAGWFFAAHGPPNWRWYDAVEFVFRTLYVAVIASLGLAAITLLMLQRLHHALGVYRCFSCGRPLPGGGSPCACAPPDDRYRWSRRRRSRRRQIWVRPLRRARRQARALALTLLAAAAVTLLCAHLLRQAPRPPVRGTEFVALHALTCLLVAMCIGLSTDVLDWLRPTPRRRYGRLRRLRLRVTVHARLLLAWPVLAFIAGCVMYALGYDPVNPHR